MNFFSCFTCSVSANASQNENCLFCSTLNGWLIVFQHNFKMIFASTVVNPILVLYFFFSIFLHPFFWKFFAEPQLIKIRALLSLWWSLLFSVQFSKTFHMLQQCKFWKNIFVFDYSNLICHAGCHEGWLLPEARGSSWGSRAGSHSQDLFHLLI